MEKKRDKFKVGDCVMYVKKVSNTNSNRDIGDTFIVHKIYERNSNDNLGDVYYPENFNGEYGCDLELATKLHKALL